MNIDTLDLQSLEIKELISLDFLKMPLLLGLLFRFLVYPCGITILAELRRNNKEYTTDGLKGIEFTI